MVENDKNDVEALSGTDLAKKGTSRFKKSCMMVNDVFESYFEKRAIFAVSGNECENGLLKFLISFLSATLFPLSISAFMLCKMCDECVGIKDEGIKPTFAFQTLCLLPSVFASAYFTYRSEPPLCQYKRHFTDIDTQRINSIYVAAASIIIYTILGIYNQFAVTTLVAVIGHLIIWAFFIRRHFIYNQQRTKLRIQPTQNNQIFKQTNFSNKDKGTVRIVESSVFKITLKNIGSQPWISDNCSIHRSANEKISFKLPHFVLLPEEEVNLIPETAEYSGECVRIPEYHCFGIHDRYFTVKTSVIYDNPIGNMINNDYRFHDEMKIAELTVEYQYQRNSSWINVTGN